MNLPETLSARTRCSDNKTIKIRRMNTMKKTYRIEGLDCANCAAKIEGMISKLDGVNSCTINFITGKIIIDADDEKFETVLKEAAHVCRKVERDAEIIVK